MRMIFAGFAALTLGAAAHAQDDTQAAILAIRHGGELIPSS